jgi:hypothetical protein
MGSAPDTISPDTISLDRVQCELVGLEPVARPSRGTIEQRTSFYAGSMSPRLRRLSLTTHVTVSRAPVRTHLLVHDAGGLVVLLAVTALSIYKPWGRTAYGRRKLGDESTP